MSILILEYPEPGSTPTRWSHRNKNPSPRVLSTFSDPRSTAESRVPVARRRRTLQLRRSGRPCRFPEGIESVEFGPVLLLNVPPADFHRRRETVVLNREEVVRDVQPLHELVPANKTSVTERAMVRRGGETYPFNPYLTPAFVNISKTAFTTSSSLTASSKVFKSVSLTGFFHTSEAIFAKTTGSGITIANKYDCNESPWT